MNDKVKINLKSLLKEKAVEILKARIEVAGTAMKEAQLAANEEGKSSVGDKYETSRAMAQIDRDIHAKQLESSQKELSFIQHVDVTLFCKDVHAGAFVQGSNGKYFFLTGLGPIEVNGERIFFLSINSPIGLIFSGKHPGDKVVFNSMEILILDIF